MKMINDQSTNVQSNKNLWIIYLRYKNKQKNFILFFFKNLQFYLLKNNSQLFTNIFKCIFHKRQ